MFLDTYKTAVPLSVVGGLVNLGEIEKVSVIVPGEHQNKI